MPEAAKLLSKTSLAALAACGLFGQSENLPSFEVASVRPHGPASLGQIKLMLRSLLADRFQLKVHQETREVPVYALIVAKNGPKLKLACELSPGTHGGYMAVQEQIGLKLEPQRAPMEVLIVDQIEKPSAN